MNNLITISGKINSGKDTVGQMIRFIDAIQINKLKLEDFNYSHFKDWLNIGKNDLGVFINSNYKIVKFADKLKDCVCLILGCTREQLEDSEFKDTPLGKEWQRWGIIRVDACSKRKLFFPSTHEQILKHHEKFKGSTLYWDTVTPRLFMQLLRTECGRQIIHPNIWCNATFADYQVGGTIMEAKAGGKKIKHRIDLTNKLHRDMLIGEALHKGYTCFMPNWVITDVRFPNEVQAIKERGGIVIRINRPCPECGVIEGHKMIPHKNSKLYQDEHSSETALDDYQNWDYVINNNSTLEELLIKVKEIIK